MKFRIALLTLLVFATIGCKTNVDPITHPSETNTPQWLKFENSNDTVRDMIDTHDYIYAATQNNGLMRVEKENQHKTYFNTLNANLPENFLNSVALDADSNIWIGTQQSGLIKYDGNSWINYTTDNSEIPDNNVRSIDCYGNEIWIGTWNGVAKFDLMGWTVYDSLNSNLPDNRIRKVKISNSGTIWVGSQTAGLAKLENNHWTVFNDTNSGLVDNMIRTIEFDFMDDLWTATYLKFYTFDQNIWEAFDESNTGISSKFVNDIAFGNDGKIYFATHHGFSVLSNDQWEQFFNTNSTMSGNIAEVVLVDKFNNKWIGTFGGVAVYNESGVKL